MSFWKIFANVSTAAATATAFFLFGCSADESKVAAAHTGEVAGQYATYTESDMKAAEINLEDWDRQMAANKAALDAIPEYDSSQEETEIEEPEGLVNVDALSTAKEEEVLIFKPFSEVLGKVYKKGPMTVGRGGYMPTPSRKRTDSMPSDSAILAIYKYVHRDQMYVQWCPSDAKHTQEDFDAFLKFQANSSEKVFNAHIAKVINTYGGHDVVLNSCR